jgi:hypothetical protein
MAQDIRDLFQKEQSKNHGEKMSSGHEKRFLKKLDAELPVKKTRNIFWLQIAASVIIVFGLSYGMFTYFNNAQDPVKVADTNTTPETPTKSLGDISPDLKKVEDYYLANINLELSKVKLTPENKELIDGYISRLEELNKEYKRLSVELTESGPNELTVNALITNLKFRLNLMYRLKEQLQMLNETKQDQNKSNA